LEVGAAHEPEAAQRVLLENEPEVGHVVLGGVTSRAEVEWHGFSPRHAGGRVTLEYMCDTRDPNANELVHFTGLTTPSEYPSGWTIRFGSLSQPPDWAISGPGTIGVLCPLCKGYKAPMVVSDDLLCGACLRVLLSFGRLGDPAA
jgi:hypothetical protein